MTPQTPGVSVIEPVSPAIETVKATLFKPFDLGKWFVIGFCAWLAQLSQGGFHFNFPFRGFDRSHLLPSQLQNFFEIRLPLIITIGAVAFIIGTAILVVCLWLSSRGKFMFLYCVALNKAEVKTPWHRFRQQGNSLFLFRLAVGVVFLLCLLLFTGAIVLFVALFGRYHGNISPPVFVAVALLSFILVPVAIGVALILKLTSDFVVPLMYLRPCTCVEAWREFWALLSKNIGRFALYILFQIVIAMAIGAIVVAAVLVTCCCAGALLAIPYIGTVLKLPLLMFSRAYSLLYLRQFGPQFDVFLPVVPQRDTVQTL